jgi:hemerythrin
MTFWRDDYATGNAMVDEDHKQVFSLVENVLSSSLIKNKEKNEATINFLMEYTTGHFAREEALMAESDYPETETHKKEHSDFLAVAIQLKEDFDNGGFALGDLEDHPDTRHLNKFVKDVVVKWLVNHVMGSDKNLARHYRSWSTGK